MSKDVFARARQRLLNPVHGNVLEIGFGTGLNLAYYPTKIEKLTTVDISSGMNRRAQRRIADSPIKLENCVLNGESLPMERDQFDCIVSTWTLCSIAQVDQALKEIRRVLKPEGKFFFIEHGLSPDPQIQRWQHRLNPIQKVIGCGCRLDRNMKDIIVSQGWILRELHEYYMENAPKTHGYMYEGIATTK